MSRTPARITQADVTRATRAAMQCGADRVEIKPDGTIFIHLTLMERAARVEKIQPERTTACRWDDAFVDDTPTYEPVPASQRAKARTGINRPEGERRTSKHEGDPDVLERFMRGEIPWNDIPPGRYPGGLTVYAHGEWEEMVRAKPLGKLEIAGLQGHYRQKGTIGYVKGCGCNTTARLVARGYLEIVQERGKDRFPYYGITPAGEAAWLSIASRIACNSE